MKIDKEMSHDLSSFNQNPDILFTDGYIRTEQSLNLQGESQLIGAKNARNEHIF